MNREVLNDVIQWDVKSWGRILPFWDNNIEWQGVQHCLELGGRQGGLSLWLALKGKPVLCSDLSQTQKTAEALHKKYNVSRLVSYRDIDATNIPFTDYFDVVVFKSILGGIGKNDNFNLQQKVIDEIHKALKPGGKLLFAENMIASRLHRLLREKFISWGNDWRYVSMEEMQILLKSFSGFEFKTTGVLALLGRNEKQRNFLAGLDDYLFNQITPESWRYIGYGFAVK